MYGYGGKSVLNSLIFYRLIPTYFVAGVLFNQFCDSMIFSSYFFRRVCCCARAVPPSADFTASSTVPFYLRCLLYAYHENAPNPPAYFGTRVVCTQTEIFSAKPVSKNAGKSTLFFGLRL
jgi:hypothetical protein